MEPGAVSVPEIAQKIGPHMGKREELLVVLPNYLSGPEELLGSIAEFPASAMAKRSWVNKQSASPTNVSESAFGQSIRRGLPWPRPARSLQFNAGRKIEENGRGHK